MWLIALTGLAVLGGAAGAARGAATVARRQVETAADLAALAAATRASAGMDDGCAVAARIAAANGAELVACRLTGAVAEVTAQKSLTAGRLGRYRVAVRVRAGPAGQGEAVTGASATSGP